MSFDYFNDRSWMYSDRIGKKGSIKEHFYNGVTEFINFAKLNNRNNVEIRCPCNKCQHLKHWKEDVVQVHLYKFGFVPNYYLWDRHGEFVAPTPTPVVLEDDTIMTNPIENMVEDAARSMFPNIDADNEDVDVEEEPTEGVKKIYDLLNSAKKPKERITEFKVDEEVVKKSNTSRKSARKQSRPTQVRKIMDYKTSLKGVGQRNNGLSVVLNTRLHIDQTDDAKSNKKNSAIRICQIETETPESLKYVLNSGCNTAQIENETQLNEEENPEDFFIQSGSRVKTIDDRLEFDCELNGDEPHNDVCHLNVEDQVLKMLDSAPMKIKLPFVKLSTLWEALESSEVLLSMPQQPHFLPLKQYSESYREGMAIGLMVTFSKVVDNIRKLCISDPDEIIEQNMETLVDLERHGFNLYNLRDMLECFRSLKEDHKQVMDGIYATNELKSDERNKEDLLNEKLEAIHMSIMELERTEKSLNDEKSSTLEQVEGFDCEIIKLQNDKKAIEKSFLAAKSSLDCARGSMR